MVFHRLHRAITLWRWQCEQDRLKTDLVDHDDFPWSLDGSSSEGRLLRRIAGVDISFFGDGHDMSDNRACVALVVCELNEDATDVQVVWKDFEMVRMSKPYIPGFLAFREAPFHCAMLERLLSSNPELAPDVILVDGNGVLHPRGFGVASHFGVLSGSCTIGIAKNLHVVDGLDRGRVREQVLAAKDSFVPLVGHTGRVWGAALLPQPRKLVTNRGPPPKNPIFVSVGHRVGLQTCVAVVKLCMLSARVPEPIRLADLLSREQVRLAKESEPSTVKPGTLQVAHRACWISSICAGMLVAAAWAAASRRRL